jgi:hypothetical protein
MKRSFSNEQRDAFLKAISASSEVVHGVQRTFLQCKKTDASLMIEGGWKEFDDYLKTLDKTLEDFRAAVIKVHEDAEEWDKETCKKLEENDLEILKYNQDQLALLQCLRPLDHPEIKVYPPETIIANLANYEALKQEGYYRALYLHYSKDRRWEAIFSKPWHLITEEEWLAVAVLQAVFEDQGNKADLDLLNQYITTKQAEQEAAQPQDWAYGDTLLDQFKDDPSVSRFMTFIKAGIPQACDDIFGTNKKNLARNIIEGISTGGSEVLGLVAGVLEYSAAGVVKGIDHIPGVDLGDSAAGWSNETVKEYHTGVAETAKGIATAVTHPGETIDGIATMWDESVEERGLEGTIAYIASEATPGMVTGSAAFKAVDGALGVTAKVAKGIDILADTKALKPIAGMADELKIGAALTKESLLDSKAVTTLRKAADDIADGIRKTVGGEDLLMAGAGGMGMTMKEADEILSAASGAAAKKGDDLIEGASGAAVKKSDDLIEGAGKNAAEDAKLPKKPVESESPSVASESLADDIPNMKKKMAGEPLDEITPPVKGSGSSALGSTVKKGDDLIKGVEGGKIAGELDDIAKVGKPGGLAKDGLGKVSGNTYEVTRSEIDAIRNHLITHDMTSPTNTAMINRLENALKNGERITGADASFYLHELKEASLMKNGMSYDVAHKAALDFYEVSPFSVYHPEVIKANPEWFNSNWLKFWDS